MSTAFKGILLRFCGDVWGLEGDRWLPESVIVRVKIREARNRDCGGRPGR